MKLRNVGNIRIYYSGSETATADLIEDACDNSIKLAAECWGLSPPEDCRIYVMTSWFGFISQSTPMRWKLMLAPSIPLWVPRIHRTWKYSAAWTQNYGSRIAIGIKPARLIEKSDRSIGVRMFVEEEDKNLNVKHVTCHELVHACSAHLFLPTWLNEGTAAVTVDRYLGKQTIRNDTLQLIEEYKTKEEPPTYGEMAGMSGEDIAYHSSRAYWLVRFLEDEFPDFLKDAFSEGIYPEEIVNQVAYELEIEPDKFWEEIDDVVTDYFLDEEQEHD